MFREFVSFAAAHYCLLRKTASLKAAATKLRLRFCFVPLQHVSLHRFEGRGVVRKALRAEM